MSTYVLLVGAKQNVGDHLIVDRATKLLEALRPDRAIVTLPRWEPLGARLDVVNEAEAVILCGGPALQRHMYPGVYPLVEDLNRIRPPVVAFGLGWKDIPGDDRDLARFSFDADSGPLLQRLARDGRVSVRDELAVQVLERNGLVGATMTGDPAWYDLDHLGRPMESIPSPSRVVVSVPADPMHHRAVEPLVRGLAERFPDAQPVAAFHHGWTAGPHVSEASASAYARLREAVGTAGVEVVDLAADLAAMEALYSGDTLHVGWRLHAHLLCLSGRRPSILLEEDCRGRGASQALGVPGVQGWRLPFRLGPYRMTRHRTASVRDALALLDRETGRGFTGFQGVPHVIDGTYRTAMKPFIEALP